MASSPSPPPPPPELNNSSSKQQYYYFFIVGMALIVVVALIANLFAIGYCACFWRIFSGQPPPTPPNGAVQTWIPAYEYRKEEKEEAEVECAVCLSAVADGEMVRELLQCRHTFHVACIDLWFRSNTSCPLCRSIVLPTPSELTEMHSREAMLASRMDGIIMSGIV